LPLPAAGFSRQKISPQPRSGNKEQIVKTNIKVQPLNPSTPSKLSRNLARSLAGMAALLLLSATMLMAQAPGFLPTPVQIVSTIPGNGDVNPYGVAFVPFGFPGGVLNPGTSWFRTSTTTKTCKAPALPSFG